PHHVLCHPPSLQTTTRPPIPPLFPYTTLFRSHVGDPEPPVTGETVLEQLAVARLEDVQGLGGPGKQDNRQREDGELARHEYIVRSEEHTSELQSHLNLVCRLLLEKKNRIKHLQ